MTTKKVGILFVLSLLMFWATRVSIVYTWISNIDLLVNGLSILYYILAVTILLLGIYFVYRVVKSNKEDKYAKGIFAFIIVLVIAFNCYLWVNIDTTLYEYSGMTSILAKSEKNEPYSFTVRREEDKDITIQCDARTHKRLIVNHDVLYKISYRGSALIEGKGYLTEEIDFKDIIDNRQ